MIETRFVPLATKKKNPINRLNEQMYVGKAFRNEDNCDEDDVDKHEDMAKWGRFSNPNANGVKTMFADIQSF